MSNKTSQDDGLENAPDAFINLFDGDNFGKFACSHLGSHRKKMSGTFSAKHPEGEFLAKGTEHSFPAHQQPNNLGILWILV